MSDKNSDQEPSIEEILASIRQIISDDDEDAGKSASAASAPEQEPEPEPQEDDPIELTEKVDEPAPEPDPEPEPEAPEEETGELAGEDPVDEEKPVQVDMMEHQEEDTDPFADMDGSDSILTPRAADAAMEGFARLAFNVPVNRDGAIRGLSLEDIVRDLLKPMLRDWLDENLPGMVERLVEKELERLARKALDE